MQVSIQEATKLGEDFIKKLKKGVAKEGQISVETPHYAEIRKKYLVLEAEFLPLKESVARINKGENTPDELTTCLQGLQKIVDRIYSIPLKVVHHTDGGNDSTGI